MTGGGWRWRLRRIAYFKEWINEHYASQVQEVVSQFYSEALCSYFQDQEWKGVREDLLTHTKEKKEASPLSPFPASFQP